MKLQKSKNCNENYLAKVVKITNLRKHTNADKLQITTIDGNNVIVGLDQKIGDVVVYVPLECAISKEFLSVHNMFRVSKNSENLNQNQSAPGGFFESHGRVRAIRLRDERSEGIVFDISNFGDVEYNVGDEFDTIGDEMFCTKYVPQSYRSQTSGSKIDNKKNRANRFDRIVADQFRYHIDTAQFAKNIHRFKLDDIISVTSKLHGTSAIFSNVLVKKELKWWERMLIKLGVDLKTEYYDNLYSSRKVIKNKYINKKAEDLGYYNEDVWKIHNDKLKDIIPLGVTLYGEIVGFTPTGQFIQKGFDYGCDEGESKFYLYRVTYTSVNGKVYEYSAHQVQQFAKQYNIPAVPEIFYGRYSEFIKSKLAKLVKKSTDETRESINNVILEYLRGEYLEGLDPMCIVEAPYEGVVIRREGLSIESYKFKSFRFLQKETEMLDSGEVDMETNESL